MLKAVKRSLARTFDYEGRSGRGEYLVYFFVAMVCLPLAPLTLAVAIPGFAATVRRLHDMDRSGRWALLPLSPVLFLIAAMLAGVAFHPLLTATRIAMVFVPLGFVIWLSRQGTPGPNRYGDPVPNTGMVREPAVPAP